MPLIWGSKTEIPRKKQLATITLGDVDEPIRAELFSVERIEQHAESLAAAQTVTEEASQGRPLIPRVVENGRVLLDSYRAIARAIQEERAITPAAEWMVDNFHIVEEQLREIHDDLPAGYYRKLPKLASGPLQGYPRVYGVAWAYVAHTDSHFDPEVLRRFVKAYQRVQALDIGELWAVAITLRVVLVENLRRLTDRIVRSRTERQEADVLADSLLGTGGQVSIPAGNGAAEIRERYPSPGHSLCNSSSVCAMLTRTWERSCTGSTNVWLSRGRPLTKLSAPSTRNKRR